jgi:hypothetical protein
VIDNVVLVVIAKPRHPATADRFDGFRLDSDQTDESTSSFRRQPSILGRLQRSADEGFVAGRA